MESDIEEVYNRNLFINTLKNGRAPKRKNLGRRLWLLAGLDPYNIPRISLEDHLGMYPYVTEPYKKITYYNTHSPVNSNQDIAKMLSDPKTLNKFSEFLGDGIITKYDYKFCVFFKKSNLISWAKLDQALMNMYPKNYLIDDNGFVQFKKIPLINNSN